MFYYSAGADSNGRGYTIWVDEVKFEKLGTIAFQSASILNGIDKTSTSFVGITNNIDGITANYSMTDGSTQAINLTPYYFNFRSSNTDVASVDNVGKVTVLGSGSSVITAALNENQVKGSLTINSNGDYIHAPIPTQNPSKVISIFSDNYTNVPVDYYNGYWAPYQTTQSSDFTVKNDNVLNYTNLNFVGIQASNPTINATSVSTFHIDLFLDKDIPAGAN